jgi:hypothetical protein
MGASSSSRMTGHGRLFTKSSATEYAALKRTLAARYPEDREAYTEAKAPFIGRVEGESLVGRYLRASPLRS